MKKRIAKRAVKCVLAVTLMIASILSLIGFNFGSIAETASASYSYSGYKTYNYSDVAYRWQVADKKLSDGTNCSGMQGMDLSASYAYVAKAGAGSASETRCAFVRTDLNTGAQTVLNYYASTSAKTPTPCNTAGHANDIVVAYDSSSTGHIYNVTLKASPAVTRMKVSGSNIYFTGSFEFVTTAGKSIALASMKLIKTEGGYHYFLLKSGTNYYYTKIGTNATGGPVSAPTKINCYKVFSIDIKNAVFATSNSKYTTISGIEGWTQQGMEYDPVNMMLYVPVWNHNKVSQNAIIVYNLKSILTSSALSATTDKGTKVYPSKLSFLIDYPTGEKFEIEAVSFRKNTAGDLKLYFNVNAGSGKEGIYSINCSRDGGPFDSIVNSSSVVYTVKYNGNGATSGSMSNTMHIKGLSAALGANKFAKTGATFQGWNLYRKSDNKWLYRLTSTSVGWYVEGKQPAGKEKAVYADKTWVAQLTTTKNDVITCYAQWFTPPVQNGTWIEDAAFDTMVYRDRHPDLANMTDAQLKAHWLQYGIKEGRASSTILDLKYYVENNADLKKAFGTDYGAAYNHFVTYGYKEYRKSSPIFDGKYYRDNHADVAKAYGNLCIKHYYEHGMFEGRQASATFDVDYYLFLRPDVAKAYPGDKVAATRHYMGHGIREGYAGYDGAKPVISNVVISNVTSTGYTVTCTITDNWGVTNVVFPTWTEKNGQDDLKGDWAAYYSGKKSGNTYTFTVKTTDHNKEKGNYITHIYAYDKAGNRAGLDLGTITVK